MSAQPLFSIDTPAADWWADLYPDKRLRDGHVARATCRDCRRPILAAQPMWARSYRLEPWPTTTAGEAFALMTGRATLRILRSGEVWERHTADIEGDHPDKTNVHAEHRCAGPDCPPNEARKPRTLLAFTGPTF